MAWYNPSSWSSSFNDVVPFVGAGVGAYFGGVPGAAIGYMAGSQFQANQANQQNFAMSERQFAQNLAFQKEQYEYSKNLQQEVFAREDNAAQRRASDLQAAGLSKTLASGSGAGAGAVVPTAAPQGQAPKKEVNQILAQNAIQLAMLSKELDMRDATIANLGKQNLNLDAQKDLLRAQKRAANAGAALDENDLKFLQDKGMWRGSSSTVRTITDTEEQIKRATETIRREQYNKNPVRVKRNGKWHTLSYDEWLKITNE